MRHGFTLIEVLVSLVILSTGIVLILRAFETSVVALDDGRDTLNAARLLRQVLVNAEANARDSGALPDLASGNDETADRSYRWQLDVHELAAFKYGKEGSGKLCEMIATVWREPAGRRFQAVTCLTVLAPEKLK